MNKKLLIVLLLFSVFLLQSQNECSKWYFGDSLALDFMSNPPGQPANSAMQSFEACASIADGAGNLLFYSNGENVWDASHNLMANGSGILGNASASQGALIVKQPGFTNKYYLFTLDDYTSNSGFRYSIVDMSLAAGMGSVTIKNLLLLNPKPSEALCSIKHCNNTDMWIVGIDGQSNHFFSFLLTSTGLSQVPVTSSINLPSAIFNIGQLKSSSNGTKVFSALTHSINQTSVRLYDFDPQTGILSNELILQDTVAFINGNNYRYYGCEFSPDGSKLYSSIMSGKIYQWDLCQENAVGIKQSRLLLPDTNLMGAGSMQLGPYGKIYVTGWQHQSLGVIHQPNAAGPACNYTSAALPIISGTLNLGLPNFPSHYFFKKKPLPFTNTVTCRTATFNPSQLSFGSPSVQVYVWNFGEPQVPAQNTSMLQNPAHTYSVPGTYTVTLVRQFACYSDTISQALTVTGCVGLEQQNGLPLVRIYPNPFQNTVKVESPEELYLTLYTQLGTLIMQQKVESGNSEIDLQKLVQDVYYLKAETKEGKSAYYKMVKTD